MASTSSNNKINVPEARQAMSTMKHEVASELGITLNNLGTIGVEMSASYADEQRVLRQAKLAALNKEHSTTVVPAITAE